MASSLNIVIYLFILFIYCRFDQLIVYGQKMIASNPRVKQLRDRVTALKQEKVALKDTWSERNDVLHEGQDLQVSRSIINQAYVMYCSLM